MFLRILTAGLFMLVVLPARADLPLTVEDLITDKGKFKLDLSLAYANANRQGVFAGEPIIKKGGRSI